MKFKYLSLKYLEEREADGVGNNIANPEWGAKDHQMIRVTPNSYTDGKGAFIPKTIAGQPNPNWIEPRDISNKVMAQPKDANGKDIDIPNSFGVNEFFQFFGQFLTHDIAEAALNGTEALVGPNAVVGLPFPFVRTPSPLDENGVRQQTTDETSFLDLSQVYGHNDTILNLLREDGSARLLTGGADGNMLPTFNEVALHHGVAVADVRVALLGTFPGAFNPEQFAVGDNRGNQNASLLTHHLMWVRNHNYHVDQLEKMFPSWTNEEIFEAARALNEAEWQNVVYTEYLTKLLGEGAIDAYAGYDPSVDPSVINEWTTVAFRFGHDQSNNEFKTLNETGGSTGLFTLAASFQLGNAAQAIRNSGQMDDWVRGQLAVHTQEIDGKVVEGNRNLLFGIPGPNGLPIVDLEVFDIMRGRDHGVGNYLTLYAGLFGNKPGFNQYDSFEEFASRNDLDSATLAALKDVYKDNIANADSIVMGLLEKPHGTGMLGETFAFLTVMQFENLRDGDRQFYLERFKNNPLLIEEVENTSLTDIIARTTGIDHIYHDAFAAHTRKAGTDASETLDGTDKADLLIALGGNDTIKAGAGNDDIHAGRGNDKIWGGAGADHFVFDKKSGRDTIYDFDVTKDVIDLSALGLSGVLSSLLTINTQAGVKIFLTATDTIDLIGVKKSQLTSDNFIFDDQASWLV